MTPSNRSAVEKRLFTVTQIAEMTSLSEATIRRAIRDEKLKAHYFGDAVRISIEDLDAYLIASRR